MLGFAVLTHNLHELYTIYGMMGCASLHPSYGATLTPPE